MIHPVLKTSSRERNSAARGHHSPPDWACSCNSVFKTSKPRLYRSVPFRVIKTLKSDESNQNRSNSARWDICTRHFFLRFFCLFLKRSFPSCKSASTCITHSKSPINPWQRFLHWSVALPVSSLAVLLTVGFTIAALTQGADAPLNARRWRSERKWGSRKVFARPRKTGGWNYSKQHMTALDFFFLSTVVPSFLLRFPEVPPPPSPVLFLPCIYLFGYWEWRFTLDKKCSRFISRSLKKNFFLAKSYWQNLQSRWNFIFLQSILMTKDNRERRVIQLRFCSLRFRIISVVWADDNGELRSKNQLRASFVSNLFLRFKHWSANSEARSQKRTMVKCFLPLRPPPPLMSLVL